MEEKKAVAKEATGNAVAGPAVVGKQEKTERFVNETLCELKLLSVKDFTKYDEPDKETGEIKKIVNLKLLDYTAIYSNGLFENPVILDAWIRDNSADYLLHDAKPFINIPCKVVIQSRVYKNGNSTSEKQEKRVTALVDPKQYQAYKDAVRALGIK